METGKPQDGNLSPAKWPSTEAMSHYQGDASALCCAMHNYDK
jgi:hypothetical protein